MSEKTPEPQLHSQPNSDIADLPDLDRDVQEGVEPLNELQQLEQLQNFFEDSHPEIFASLNTDEGTAYRDAGETVPAELVDATERMWARVPDLISHASLLVLGAGLDHQMPHVSFLRTGPTSYHWGTELDGLPELPEGIAANVLLPSDPSGQIAVSLHGGPGWFGDGPSHDFLWMPLFASLAEASGVTIVDLTYPLPGYGSWEATQHAVERATRIIRESSGELLARLGVAPAPGATGTSEPPFGLITFGSGLVAAEKLLRHQATPQDNQATPQDGQSTSEDKPVDFFVAMTPRISPTAAEHPLNLAGIPTLLSVMGQDSRATPIPEATDFLRSCGAELSVQEFVGEHIIAAPAQWRKRIATAARWLAGL